MTALSRCLVVCAVLVGACPAASWAQVAPVGSTSFCLYELPTEDNGRRRWINLGIVQYLELTRNEIIIAYGGGNLGSGHEARISVASPEAAQALLERLRRTAADCR